MFAKIQQIRSIIRKNSRYNIFISLIWLNIIGILVNLFFFSFAIPNYDIKMMLPITWFTLIWAIPLSFWIYLHQEKPITIAIYNTKNHLPINRETLTQARERLKNRPRFSALLNFWIWVVSGIYNGVISYYSGRMDLDSSIIISLGVSVLSNPVISIFVYFLVEVMSRNDMRVLEIDIDSETIGLGIRKKILFTMIFMSSLFILLMMFLSLANMKEMSHGESNFIHDRHIMQLLAITLIAAFYNTVGAHYLSKTITNPLQELIASMKKVESGDISAKVHITSTDETAVLGKGFNLMTEGLLERDQIKSEFGKYVSEEIRDEILRGGISFEGQEVEVTVLFCDIRNFTSLSEQNSPAKIVELLNQYFTEMVRAIGVHGGIVDKFIGDAIMAVFGAPKRLEDHAERAVSAGQEMLARLEAHNILQELKNEPVFQIGIGINSGKVIMGNIGAENRKEFTVIGDTVNIASRIESITKNYKQKILFSESTYRLLKKGEFIGEADLKGKAEKVKIYTI
ncbi:MAG TPA: adenylate/guanylate cyclase domain-containing protein [Leptospiraceae bacterium]|nr:adenylate/guanylate cyclase domain-containing protein [Leptospiraceae bacterium]HMY67577.1 adenylate/guanylate cyclase domain-containing protein [Leptospiraceae bacterium]HNF12208.1 adenylate/guanylate cyclase domain-containing protein [Leptospiraceae bacterium]HNI96730.1 adenylate/guanylate cyclase domain-containing protein [Leptospiraceae bacterium]